MSESLTPAEALEQLRAQQLPEMAFHASTPEDVADWQSRLRAILKDISGLDKMEQVWPCDPDVQQHEVSDHDDHRRVLMSIQTSPGYRMPFLILVPPGEGPFPTLLAFAGHGAGMGDLLGEADDDVNRKRIERLNYAYGLEAVQHGYLTIIPEKRGFGQRGGPGNDCKSLATLALQMGMSIIGMHTWDHMRLLDYILPRPDVDADHVGAIGLSGGGGSVMWLSALDERIRASVISCHLQACRDGRFGCICNAAPGLLQLADRGDIGALIAPRPLFVEAGRLDKGCALHRVEIAIDTVSKAYQQFSTTDCLTLNIHEHAHYWEGKEVWPWLASHLG